MKKSILLLSLATMLVFVISCSEGKESSDSILNKQQEQSMDEAVRQVGMPAIKNFQERKLAKLIFELRDQENLVCYAYMKNDMSGKLVYVGKCMGYGLPYSVQYTNPEKIVNRYGDNNTNVSSDIVTLPQADPNGLFMPTGLSATWLMMLDEKGNPHPVYFEPSIVVSPFKLPTE